MPALGPRALSEAERSALTCANHTKRTWRTHAPITTPCTSGRKTITIKVDLGGPGTSGQTLQVQNRYGDVICQRSVPYGVAMLTDYCTVPGGTFTVGIPASSSYPANLYVYD